MDRPCAADSRSAGIRLFRGEAWHLAGVVAALVWALAAPAGRGAGRGDETLVIYNRQWPDSQAVAEHYALVRQVPSEQVIGLDLSRAETISRSEYQARLEEPLLEAMESRHWFTYRLAIQMATADAAGRGYARLTGSRVRYAVLCYGVPLRIAPDTNVVEAGQHLLKPGLRRNEAAVDSELALLPWVKQGRRLYGMVANPQYQAGQASSIHPTNGVLIVGRVDGPSAEIARRLVDQAVAAEQRGLWGRAYFDARGIRTGTYRVGDDWLHGAAAAARKFGFETVLDDQGATFPAGFPLSHIALYAGWYDGKVSGPFLLPQVEFVPGAVAYHLFSFSASSVRTSSSWVGALLLKGATATMGCVYEPYLDATPNLDVFFKRLLEGFTFGEAALASQRFLSWQTAVVGDPLYLPMPQDPLAAGMTGPDDVQPWRVLLQANRMAEGRASRDEVIRFLRESPATASSAVLLEKMADLEHAAGETASAIATLQRARGLTVTPQQGIRITLALGRWMAQARQTREAYALYQEFLRQHPDYSDRLSVYRVLQTLATQLGQKNEADQYQAEIDRLSPPSPK
ncbi:MAG TPA: TIGR03790 family protein [Candidatus Paceibacterota bacterium]|nr:TIGR03790 family protein [Verrucomicrobiota bacterium]HOX04533.1 TIGR03790 family protein [Verrucomicrobiota bacterium]HRZ47491.1 TIGR03790 family protein [Candidatus Paceibacterota bacterium]